MIDVPNSSTLAVPATYPEAPLPSFLPSLPEAGIALRLLRRGAVTWVLVRTMLFFVGLFTRSGEQPAGALFVLDPRTMVALFAVIGVAAMIDTRRRHEHVFLANLGVSQVTATCYLLAPTLVAELVLGMVLR